MRFLNKEGENRCRTERGGIFAAVSAKVFLLGTLCVCTGCASGVLHEGAYVGNDSQYGSQARPAQRPSSSVPMFASQDVKSDAKNRVAMERATGRPVMARCVTVNDVIGWHQSGVKDENIIIHIRTHGLCQPLMSQDELTLQNHGVSVAVIRAMREHPYPKVDAPVPPARSQGALFTKPNTSPDSNPGSSYGSGSEVVSTVAPAPSRAPIPTAAPPVTARRSSGSPNGGMISSPAAPACGSCVQTSGIMTSDGAILMNDGTLLMNNGTVMPGESYGIPEGYIINDGSYVIPAGGCSNCGN